MHKTATCILLAALAWTLWIVTAEITLLMSKPGDTLLNATLDHAQYSPPLCGVRPSPRVRNTLEQRQRFDDDQRTIA